VTRTFSTLLGLKSQLTPLLLLLVLLPIFVSASSSYCSALDNFSDDNGLPRANFSELQPSLYIDSTDALMLVHTPQPAISSVASVGDIVVNANIFPYFCDCIVLISSVGLLGSGTLWFTFGPSTCTIKPDGLIQLKIWL